VHEMSLAMAVVDQVEQAAAESGVTAVSAVRVQVGELAGVVADALRFSFSLACAGTVLDGAELLTENVPGRARCTPCATAWETGMPPALCCPACGSAAELLAGRELAVTGVQWEQTAGPEPVTEGS
jgi:hydrogenase nickel incorporation protein HypA/HybF